jgi:uncharacterized protein YlxW (UPF0749 family)
MVKNKTQRNILFLSLVSVILGMMIMLSINTHRASEVKTDNNTQELIDYIENLEAEISDMETQINTTRSQIQALESSQNEEQTQISYLNDLLDLLNINAQLTDLEGPGLIITLDDNTVGAELAQKNNPATYVAENYIVHDQDLLYLIRALSQDMEACSINGVRINDSSSIRCAGTIILINSTRIAPPYEIKIIGNAEALIEDLTNCGTYLSLVYRGIPVSYEKQTSIPISAYTGAYSTTYSSIENDQIETPEETTNSDLQD